MATAKLGKSFWKRKALSSWAQAKRAALPTIDESARTTALTYVRILRENTACEVCGRVSKHGRRPLDFYPKSGAQRKLLRMAKAGAAVDSLTFHAIQECEALCRSCYRKRRYGE